MSTKNYYLIRHAEKQDPADPDTGISMMGRERAIALRNTLVPKEVQNIIVSQFQRTQQTAKPLAEAIQVPPVVMDKDDITAITKRMDEFAHSLVVGHTDNVPALIKQITGKTVVIEENEFDKLFVISITGKKKKLTRARYGAPSVPLD